MSSPELSGRLGKCEVCNNQEAKYTCPRCELKTCCLNCVKIHKKELNCDGLRNKVAFKPISKFNNLDLLSDYRFLEEKVRSVETFARDPSKQYTCTNKLPINLYKLKGAAKRRGTDLHFLPHNFTRSKANSTYFNWKEQLISWRVEWIFPQAGNIKCVSRRLDENEKLSKLVNEYLDPLRCDALYQDKLQYYQSAGLKGVVLLLKAEKRTGEKYYELETSLTLKENLKGKSVIEFPTIFVVMKDHKQAFNILGPDEEGSSEDESTSNPDKNNLLFNADYSSSEDDEKKEKQEEKPRYNKRKYPKLDIPNYNVLIKQNS